MSVKLDPNQIVAWLRRLANELELFSGPAVLSVLLFRQGGKVVMGEITVTVEDAPFGGKAVYFDAEGNPTQPDVVPNFSSSDPAVATVVTNPEDGSITVTPVGMGAALITGESQETDAQTGEVTTLIVSGTVIVNAGDAVVGSIEFTAPVTPEPPVEEPPVEEPPAEPTP